MLGDVRAGARADEALARRAGGLDARGRAFLMELAYGAVRWRGRLDHHLDALLDRGLDSLPPEVVSILELGAYQLLFMPGVPAWAAIDQSVELARSALPGETARWATGIVNAVLRNVDRERDRLALPGPEDPAGRLAVVHSHPRWLVERWLARWGQEETAAVLAADNVPPPLHLAVDPRAATPAVALERLHDSGIEARAHPLKPDAIVVEGGGRPEALPGWEDGWFWVQDAGAQWVAQAVEPVAGRLLDAFAAPGGKLGGLLARSPGARAVALDLDPARLRRVRENADRLGLDRFVLAAADVRAVPTRERFELVLADAPCSGTGVLRRRVDARWRRRPGDLDRFAAFQRASLEELAARVAPGGTLLYSTCSLEPEENEDVVAAFLERRSDFRLEPVADAVPAALREGPFLATRPGPDDVDGMFAACLVRERT